MEPLNTEIININVIHTVPESHETGELKTNNSNPLAKKAIKRKRKYSPRKIKNRVLPRSKRLERQVKLSERTNDLDSNDKDINILGKNCTQTDSFINPFALSLFLSMIQQRRNIVHMCQPVSWLFLSVPYIYIYILFLYSIYLFFSYIMFTFYTFLFSSPTYFKVC